MNLIAHLVVKDTRRIFGVLIVWGLMLLTALWTEWHALQIDRTIEWQAAESARLISILFQIMVATVAYVVAASLVVDDSATSSAAFWMTRPVSGIRLVAAKWLTCVTWFVALPVFATLIWWRLAGESFAQLSVRVSGMLWGQVTLVATAFVVATFTGTFGRFVGATLGLFFLGGVAAKSTVLRGVLKAADVDVFVMAIRVVALGTICAAVVRYQTRSARRPIAIAVIGVSAAVATVLLAVK